MPLTTRFEGFADLYSTRNGFKEKKNQVVDFTASFDDDGHWTVKTGDFHKVVIDDIEGPNNMTVKLTVTLAQDASATAVGTDGTTLLQATFSFTLKISVAQIESILALELDNTGPHEMEPGTVVQGAAVDRTTGALALAGIGTFSKGKLDGDKCAVLLRGKFVPNPWS